QYTREWKACQNISGKKPEPIFVKKQFASGYDVDAEVLCRSLLKKVNAGTDFLETPEIRALLLGPFGNFVASTIGCEFKIHGGWLHRKPCGWTGAKDWHADSGPGTRFNVFLYLSPGSREYGPTSFLPWEQSERIFQDEISLLEPSLLQ